MSSMTVRTIRYTQPGDKTSVEQRNFTGSVAEYEVVIFSADLHAAVGDQALGRAVVYRVEQARFGDRYRVFFGGHQIGTGYSFDDALAQIRVHSGLSNSLGVYPSFAVPTPSIDPEFDTLLAHMKKITSPDNNAHRTPIEDLAAIRITEAALGRSRRLSR